MKQLGDIIRSFRNQKGVMSKDMANELGITPNYLSLIEKNEKEPSIELLADIASYFKVPISVLLFEVLKAEDFKNNRNKKVFEQSKPLIEKLINILITDERRKRPKIATRSKFSKDLLTK